MLKRGKDGIKDPDVVVNAMRATGCSQVGIARLLGVSQASVSLWTRGGKMNEWNHRMLVRFGEVKPGMQGSIYYLLKEDRVEDALSVCLGVPAPVQEVER